MAGQGSQTVDLQCENDCKICNKEVGNKEKALNCDICMRWIHAECVKMDSKMYVALKKVNAAVEGIKWLCETCEKGFGKIRMDVLKIIEGQTRLEEKQVKLESKVDNCTLELVEMRKEMVEMKKGLKKMTLGHRRKW